MTADNAPDQAPATHQSETNQSVTEKIWLKSYAEGVPAYLPAPEYPSIPAMIAAACQRYGNKPAFTCMDRSLSYRALDAKSGWLAGWLSAKGLVKGDRVAVMMPNILQYPLSIAAILRAGLIAVNINPLYTPRELAQQLNDCGAKAIIILENFAGTLEKALPEIEIPDIHKPHILVASMGDMLGIKGLLVNYAVRRVKKLVPQWHLPNHTTFKSALSAGRFLPVPMPELEISDIAFLQYTGGTTGVSKGAMLTHGNILANLDQMRLWLDVAYRLKGKPDDVNYICALPLYHVFALTVNAMIGIQQGARNILIPNPRDIKSFVKELQKYPFHIFPALNTLFNALMNNQDFKNLNFKPLILTLGGGMAVQKPIAERWYEMTGCLITEGYGLSETSPVVAANGLDATQFTGTIGLPMPSTDIAIIDDGGTHLPYGEVGEICVRGPQLMRGYWQRSEDTARSITSDGFFRTGDLGFMDENGYTKIVDRKKDMILVSGFNVYPNEVEEVVVGHTGIKEAAAIGIPDRHSGEIVKLFIVRSDPNLTETDVRAYCAQHLTNYKRPRMIEFRDELPKSNVGKILRRKLRE